MLGSLGEISYDIVSRDKTAEGLNKAGDRARQVGKVAGAAMTGIGVGMIVLTDSAKKTNATIRQTALQLDVSAKEMRELTLATTNVTFPIEEVTASFDLLTRAGMRNKDEIAAAATAFDTLGDAIGMNASEVTEIMVPAFNAFGISLADAGEYTDIFTHLTRNTTVELGDFSTMLKYIAPELDVMDISMAESVAVMEALADKGIQGSAATREFRSAISKADGDMGLFYETLGITEDEVAKYSKEINDSTGLTDKFADAANTQFGTVDKVKHSISELTLKYGSMLEPLDALGPAMTTLGPIMITMSSVQWGTLVPALMAHATAAWAAIAPYLAIILPIVAVIAILYILEKKFGVLTKAAEYITEGFGRLVSFIRDIFSGEITSAGDIVGMFGDKILFLLGPIGAVIYAIKNWEEIWTFIKALFDKILKYLADLADKFRAAGTALVQALIDGITSLIGRPADILRGALGGLRAMLPGSDAKEGPLSDLTHSGKALVETFAEGMENADTTIGATFEKALPAVSVAKGIGGEGGISRGGDTFNFGPITISNDYDVENMWAKIQELQQAKRVQRGINAV